MTDYIGFSAFATSAPRDTRMGGTDLVKQDLLNHFNTEPGQALGRPSFGCRLRQRLGQPFDAITRTEIENDVKAVFKYDPRVELLGVEIQSTEVARSYSIACKIKYTGTDLVARFEFFVTADGVS